MQIARERWQDLTDGRFIFLLLITVHIASCCLSFFGLSEFRRLRLLCCAAYRIGLWLASYLFQSRATASGVNEILSISFAKWRPPGLLTGHRKTTTQTATTPAPMLARAWMNRRSRRLALASHYLGIDDSRRYR